MKAKEQLESNNNIVYSCKYHVIGCPKYRRPVLIDATWGRLKELIRQQATRFSADRIEVEVMPDPGHLRVEGNPQLGIHRLVKYSKGCTSRILREEFKTLRTRIPTLWTNSYGGLAVGGAPLSVIQQYIENQKRV